MKRILALGTVGYVIAALICITFERQVSVICLAVFSSLFILSLITAFRYKETFFPLCIILALSVISFSSYLFLHSDRVEKAHNFDGYNGEITAQITEINTTEYYSQLKVNRVKINGESLRTHILVNLSDSAYDFKEGDFVALSGQLHTDFSTLFDYSEEKYLASQNIFLMMDADNIEKTNINPNHFRNFVFDYRESSLRQTNTLKHGGFISALALGDKSHLDADIQADFQKLGLQHTLAVSGMHLSLVVMSIYVFLQRYSFGKYPLSIICSLITVFYMALTGFTFSIIRAGIMMLTYFISLLIRRDNDSITTLFTSALFICIINPWSISDIGFQLSFFATLGILVFAKPLIEKSENMPFFTRDLPSAQPWRFIVRKFKGAIKSVIATFYVTLSATLATIPLTLIYFDSLTPFAVVANVTVIFLINLVLITSVIYIIISPVLFSIFDVAAAYICDTLSSITLSLTDFLADILPNPIFFPPETSEILGAICGLILLIMFLVGNNYKTALYGTLAFAVAITVALGIINYTSRSTSYITFTTSNYCRDTIIESSSDKTLVSLVGKNNSYIPLHQIINYRKAYTFDTVVIFYDNVSPYNKIKSTLLQSKIERLVLVALDEGLTSREKSEISNLVKTDIEYIRANEYKVNDTVSFEKIYDSYIEISTTQGSLDASIIYLLNENNPPTNSKLNGVEGVVILGAEDYCPRYFEKVFYLCDIPEKALRGKNTSNSDEFDFGIIKISDKKLDYKIY